LSAQATACPTLLFVGLLVITWITSWLLSYFDFGVADPRTGEPLQVVNQLSGAAMTSFLASMVKNLAHFHPIGVLLGAMLGIGVAEHTGFINSASRASYVKGTGIGTLTAMMLSYSISFIVAWTLFLLMFWAIGLPGLHS
jgi:p-aminobenzoyl-glutamate transporter AbgT